MTTAAGPDWEVLRARLRGPVHLHRDIRERFASDESIYAITPQAVAAPRDEADLREIVAFARSHRIPLTARAGGTSLAGQSVGAGIVVDISDQFDRILTIDALSGTVLVEPGVVLADLNQALVAFGKQFGPDPSSFEMCRVGGMIANNASGVHHRIWGATIDNVVTLRLMLSNGETVETSPTRVGSDDHLRRCKGETLEARIYREVPPIIRRLAPASHAAWPRVDKSSSGYRLDRALAHDVFDLGKLVCGSEGTLALVLRATLRIVDRPKARGLVVFYFSSLEDTAAGVRAILATQPSAVEMIDERVIEVLRRQKPEEASRFIAGTRAALFVEYLGDDLAQVESKMAAGWRVLREGAGRAINDQATTDPGTMADLWRIRRGIEPMLGELSGLRAPVGFVEDTAVPVERLEDHVRGLYAIFDRYGLDAAAYGHASMGHLHVRPYLNLKDPGDRKLMEQVAAEVFEQTRRLGGTMSGEHGDGLLRTEFLAQFFQEAYEAMVAIKRIMDPDGIFNPGKKVEPEPGQMTKYLRAARAP